ncbi:hypothetical protein CFIICLFH_3972 [Methylobacterium goesingense]|nr:hypothetical protein CFIICLFH_3972 [Methylobacterium goesingense]
MDMGDPDASARPRFPPEQRNTPHNTNPLKRFAGATLRKPDDDRAVQWSLAMILDGIAPIEGDLSVGSTILAV